MHGDLVNALCYTAFTPVYLWMWLREPVPGADHIVAAFAWTAVFSWISYWKQNSPASVLACLGMSASIAGMNLYQWPHSDEVVVVPQFLWSLLIISGNAPLSFAVKTAMAVVALLTALAVAVYSPLLEVSDALPILLGAAAVHVLFHYYAMMKTAGKKGVDQRTRCKPCTRRNVCLSHVKRNSGYPFYTWICN